MNNLIKLVAIAFFYLAIVLLPQTALADTVKSNTADSTKQAAKEAVKETGVKEQFGKSASGEQLLDNAQDKANEKLNNLAEKAKSGEDLPDSEKLFLKNLQGK
jgi:cell division protein FtsL